jgi:hypothetical protein
MHCTSVCATGCHVLMTLKCSVNCLHAGAATSAALGAQSGHFHKPTAVAWAAVNAFAQCADGLHLLSLHAWGDHPPAKWVH